MKSVIINVLLVVSLFNREITILNVYYQYFDKKINLIKLKIIYSIFQSILYVDEFMVLVQIRLMNLYL